MNTWPQRNDFIHGQNLGISLTEVFRPRRYGPNSAEVKVQIPFLPPTTAPSQQFLNKETGCLCIAD